MKSSKRLRRLSALCMIAAEWAQAIEEVNGLSEGDVIAKALEEVEAKTLYSLAPSLALVTFGAVVDGLDPARFVSLAKQFEALIRSLKEPRF